MDAKPSTKEKEKSESEVSSFICITSNPKNGGISNDDDNNHDRNYRKSQKICGRKRNRKEMETSDNDDAVYNDDHNGNHDGNDDVEPYPEHSIFPNLPLLPICTSSDINMRAPSVVSNISSQPVQSQYIPSPSQTPILPPSPIIPISSPYANNKGKHRMNYSKDADNNNDNEQDIDNDDDEDEDIDLLFATKQMSRSAAPEPPPPPSPIMNDDNQQIQWIVMMNQLISEWVSYNNNK